MKVDIWIMELRQQLEEIQVAIVALEHVARNTRDGRGRPPAWLAEARKHVLDKTTLRAKGSESSHPALGASENSQALLEPSVTQAVLEMAIHQPRFSSVRVANELRKRGVSVSRVDVQNVWVQHDLQTIAKRLRRTAFQAELSQKSGDPSTQG
jgi:hypothetical protein